MKRSTMNPGGNEFSPSKKCTGHERRFFKETGKLKNVDSELKMQIDNDKNALRKRHSHRTPLVFPTDSLFVVWCF